MPVSRVIVHLDGASPEQRYAIRAELSIIRNQGHAFSFCLGEQETVEWIAVVEREPQECGAVCRRDGEQDKTVERQLTREDFLVRSREFQFPERHFDGHFPEAGGADV